MMDEIALTFDDVSIIPQYSEILPSEVDTSVKLTPQINLKVPIISAAMDTVTEYKMAIALAQLGGLGVIHKNMSIDEQTSQVKMVKRHDGGVVKDPITVNDYHLLGEVKTLSEVSGFSSFPVVTNYTRYNSSKKVLIGFLTARDIRFQTDDDIIVELIMTPYSKLIVATEEMTREQMRDLMYQFKVEKMPVVKMEGDTPILRGLITMKDMEIMDKMPNATRDKDRRLMVAAAVGVSDKEKERAGELISAGVDALVVDSAHGHSKRVIDMVEWLKSEYPHIGIIAGNVVTAEGVDALYQAGANCVKVGIRFRRNLHDPSGLRSRCTSIHRSPELPLEISGLDDHLRRRYQIFGRYLKSLRRGSRCRDAGRSSRRHRRVPGRGRTLRRSSLQALSWYGVFGGDERCIRI